MKSVLPALLILAIVLPVGVLADSEEISPGWMMNQSAGYQYGPGMMNSSYNNSWGYGPGMMGAVNEQALDPVVHNEMKNLVEKMMTGTMSRNETARLVQLMTEYPVPYSTMKGRMTPGTGYPGHGVSSVAMMNGVYGPAAFGTMGILSVPIVFTLAAVLLLVLIWIIVGILLIIWLYQKLYRP